MLKPGVIFTDDSADFRGSPLPGANRALLGVDFVIVDRRVSPVGGTAISTGVIASTQGLLELSDSALLTVGAFELFLALLSFLLSRMLFGSPLTWADLFNPEELEPEFDSANTLELMLDVSIVSPLFGDLPRPEMS